MNSQNDFLLHQSVECLQKGDLDAAEKSLVQVIAVEPSNPHALQFLGMIAAQRGQHFQAIDYLNQSIKFLPENFIACSNLGNQYSHIGDYGRALDAYSQSIQAEPRYEEAWFNRGNVLYELGRIDEAMTHYDQALSLSPNHAPGWFIVGDKLNVIGRFEEALIRYDKAISLVPGYIEAWINKGVALQGLKRFDEAISHYDQAIHLAPNYAQAYSNKGNSLNELGHLAEAVAQHQKAIALKPDYAEAFYNLGIALSGLHQYEEAIANYDKAISIRPELMDVWINKGLALHSLGQFNKAIESYDKLLQLKPEHVEAWFNRGAALNSLKRFDEAIENYRKLLEIKPDYAEAWLNFASNYYELRQFEKAVLAYSKALSLCSNLEWLRGDLLHASLKIANWQNLEKQLDEIYKGVYAGKGVINPFSLMGVTDDISMQLKSAKIYTSIKFPKKTLLSQHTKFKKKQKILIGYYSPDFKDHPVAFLVAELFELHDKDRFEIIAFSYGPDDGGVMRPRIEKAFNQFIDVSNMSDLEVAKLSRDLGIDIAVDLAGYTSGSRTGIFAYRAAPIQINFLGYPGTMGADYIDYIITDRTLIPKQSQQFYTEKVIYLPNTYQPNDQKREISDRKFTKQELGLPEKGFVFCCFNNSYKILPETFSRWMRILKQVEGSVLWLLEDHPMASENLRIEAAKRDIDSSRLIFAKRALLPDHLSRHSQADLFLDTWPYNAHTTASDALWAGLPILTLMGESFASRVAASLLNAVGLPELIATSPEQYEAMAIDLAKNSRGLLEIREKLSENRLRKPLFDTPHFVKNLEAAYLELYEVSGKIS